MSELVDTMATRSRGFLSLTFSQLAKTAPTSDKLQNMEPNNPAKLMS